MGGAACKIIIDNGNEEGMGEQLIGSLRQLQKVTENVSKTIADLDEYLTREERHEALELSYETCDFADKEILPFSKKVQDFADKVAKFYIRVSKAHSYERKDSGEGAS